MTDGLKSKENRPKRYVCTFKGCNKKYTRPCLLEQHIRSHTNERRFKCAIDGCGKPFLRPCHLKVHSWTHSDIKPRTCDHCGRGFTTSQQLSRHLATHGEKPDSSSSPSVKIDKSEITHDLELDPTNSIGRVDDKSARSSVDTSSKPIIPDLLDDSITKRLCPYGCGKSFVTETELGDHMLENHLMSEILHNEQLCTHPSGQFSPLSDLNLVTKATEVNIPADWQDHKCKEEQCQGYGAFPDTISLIQHYDTFHSFVPFSLISPVFEHPDSITASGPSTVGSRTVESSPFDDPSTDNNQICMGTKESKNEIFGDLTSASGPSYPDLTSNEFMNNPDWPSIDEFLSQDLLSNLSVL